MGLDTVELVMRTEEEFAISIPDRDVERIVTVRGLAHYVATRVALVQAGECLTRQAFYRLRASLRSLGAPRSLISPGRRFDDLFSAERCGVLWNELRGSELDGIPPLRRSFWTGAESYPKGCETIGQLARHIATQDSRVRRPPCGPWTRETVLLNVRRIVSEELGVEAFDDTARFVEDLGAD